VQLITDAANSGDPAKLDQAAALAKASYPESAAEIDALVADLRAQAAAARLALLLEQGVFEGWSGEGEAGASQTTGTARNTTVALGLKLNKVGIDWEHHFIGLVDYQRSDGRTTDNRELASYEADYNFAPVLKATGLVQWEQDPFAGFNRRLTETAGLAYTIFGAPDVTWLASAGPAWRQTRFTDDRSVSDLSGHGATNFTWHITPGTVFSEDAGFYVGGRDNTYYSTTALTMSVFGNLSARVSFNINIESNPPAGIDNTSTISRVTLVYSF
jgi:putative salt-induced outer membrane protein